MARQYKDLAETTLASSLASGATSMSVTSATRFPTGGDFMCELVEGATRELVLVTAVSGTTFTITRAQGTPATTDSSFTTAALVRLVLDTAGLLAIGGGSGTAFPSSPATNLRFYRNDLALEFYYDGTRWVTTQIMSISFHGFASAFSDINALQTVSRQPVPYVAGGTDLWLVAAVFASYVTTPVDGSNFWTIDLRKRNAANTATVIATRAASADTTDNWTRAEVSIAALLGGVATYKEIDLDVQDTGSPGTIFPTATLHYRIVAT